MTDCDERRVRLLLKDKVRCRQIHRIVTKALYRLGVINIDAELYNEALRCFLEELLEKWNKEDELILEKMSKNV